MSNTGRRWLIGIFIGGIFLTSWFLVDAIATHESTQELHTIPGTTIVIPDRVITDDDPIPHATVPTTTTPAPGGTLLVVANTWECNRPVADYAVDGLPLHVVVTYADRWNGQGVRLNRGCVGDGTPAIDLDLDVQGDGNVGPLDDAIRFTNADPPPSDLDITGKAGCGDARGTPYHQDGIHAISGTNINFVNFEIGNYDAGVSTCNGAGGIVFVTYSPTNANIYPRNFNVSGGKFIGCNHSFNNGGPRPATGTVSDASFRSGRPDDPRCIGMSAIGSPPCLFNDGLVRGPNVVCQRWVNGAWSG